MSQPGDTLRGPTLIVRRAEKKNVILSSDSVPELFELTETKSVLEEGKTDLVHYFKLKLKLQG